jgi:hypothetical protein
MRLAGRNDMRVVWVTPEDQGAAMDIVERVCPAAERYRLTSNNWIALYCWAHERSIYLLRPRDPRISTEALLVAYRSSPRNTELLVLPAGISDADAAGMISAHALLTA